MTNSSLLQWPKNSNPRALPENDAKQVFHLLEKVDIFVGKASGIFKKKADEKQPTDINVLLKEVRDYWYNHPELIDQFISMHTNELTEKEVNIVHSWKQHIVGQFICIKYYKNYAIFAHAGEEKDSPTQYYAVLAIVDDFDEVLPFDPPYMLNVGLLPYKGIIIWDGLIQHYPILFGSNMKQSFNDEYRKFKRKKKVISKLA
jgi:hypothetical protein